MRLIDVQGWCPMGCGRTLHVNMDTGMIFCINKACSRPLAVTELISTEWKTHHTTVFRPGGFEIKHPLAERVTGSLLDCPLQRWLNSLEGPPVTAGTYHVEKTGHDLTNAIGPDGSLTLDGWTFTEKTEERF